MVTTDGHIIDVFGPYAATVSDAEIIKQLFHDTSNIGQYFRDNNVFILDRGFRDAIDFLSSLNYSIYKPESLEEGETQLSTTKANKSRCVTLCRWVVEVVNGRFKRVSIYFKIFRNTFFNTFTTHLMEDFRIAAAIINAFHPVIVDRPDASLVLDRALQRLNMQNHFADYIIKNNINRMRATFTRIDGNIPALEIFPTLTMSDLILFGLGIYQIKQARSYYGEHIRPNGSFEVEVSSHVETTHISNISSSQETVIIRGRIRSRHRGRKMYYTYILINLRCDNWDDTISGYYCNCIVGKRTVGCDDYCLVFGLGQTSGEHRSTSEFSGWYLGKG